MPCASVIEMVITWASGSKLTITKDQATIGPRHLEGTDCVSVIVGGGTDGEILLGLLSMNIYYVVFDMDNSRLGIARAKP